ncbi:hypothetical protein L596_005371 [Steinernema carpocapsae]|uniref:Uncharacterized protein n=1 Tax=Steinernema carpocapsae TaxID=34508 RepID=A0A4U8V0D6_STECR|nr:hypothetical protein L596_005371 [Steinernema carpocapsae]
MKNKTQIALKNEETIRFVVSALTITHPTQFQSSVLEIHAFMPLKILTLNCVRTVLFAQDEPSTNATLQMQTPDIYSSMWGSNYGHFRWLHYSFVATASSSPHT